MALKIDGRSYSPSVLEKAMHCAATQPAYHLASKSLAKVGDIAISGRHLGNLAEGIGEELAELFHGGLDLQLVGGVGDREGVLGLRGLVHRLLGDDRAQDDLGRFDHPRASTPLSDT